jgi:hypothetical protein
MSKKVDACNVFNLDSLWWSAHSSVAQEKDVPGGHTVTSYHDLRKRRKFFNSFQIWAKVFSCGFVDWRLDNKCNDVRRSYDVKCPR